MEKSKIPIGMSQLTIVLHQSPASPSRDCCWNTWMHRFKRQLWAPRRLCFWGEVTAPRSISKWVDPWGPKGTQDFGQVETR
jgi:hypothetical protein